MVRRFSRYQGRRRFRKRRRGSRFFKNAGRAIGLASSALAVARGVKSLLNVEYKVVPNVGSSFAINTTGTMDLISGIGEGSASYERNGKSVKMTSLNGRMHFAYNTAGNAAQCCRVIIFQDMHGEGGTPGISDVLDGTGWNGLRNLDNTDRFKVLRDMTIQLTDSQRSKLIKIFIKRKCKLEFLGSTSAVAYQGAGSVWILTIGNQSTNAPTMSWDMRLRYIDN